MTNEEMYEVIRDVQEKSTRGMKAFKRPAFAGLDKTYAAYMEKYIRKCNIEAEESLKAECSIKDTAELKKLILENPDLPLLIFCGEESWNGDYAYSQAEAHGIDVKKLTLYNEMWMPEDEYRETLENDLADDYKKMTDSEYSAMIDEKVSQTAFIKAITVYVG